MRNLKDILEEIFSTPANTMGIGNTSIPNPSANPGELSGEIGSGDIFVDGDTKISKKSSKKKRKKITKKEERCLLM